MADDSNIPIKMYFTEVSFDSIQIKETNSLFNQMPTSLELSSDEVDQLIAAGYERFAELLHAARSGGELDGETWLDGLFRAVEGATSGRSDGPDDDWTALLLERVAI